MDEIKQNIRYGTFLCWAFGHKFIARNRKDKFEDGRKHTYFTYFDVSSCVRCGLNTDRKVENHLKELEKL